MTTDCMKTLIRSWARGSYLCCLVMLDFFCYAVCSLSKTYFFFFSPRCLDVVLYRVLKSLRSVMRLFGWTCCLFFKSKICLMGLIIEHRVGLNNLAHGLRVDF